VSDQVPGSYFPIPHGDEWVSKCDLCGQPFLYNPSRDVIKVNNPDAGERRGQVWAHTKCHDRAGNE
jgi:hypothetical protein